MKIFIQTTIALICALLSMLACTKSNETGALPPYTANIEVHDLRADSVLCHSRGKMYGPHIETIDGDSMLISDMHNNEIFQLFSIDGDSLVCSFGSRGMGPGQFIGVPRVQNGSDGSIHIFDSGKNTMYKVKDTGMLMAIDTVGAVRFNDMSGGTLYKTVRGYVGDNMYGDGSIFTFFDQEGVAKYSFGLVPGTEKKELASPDFYMAYQVVFAVSPNGKYLCAAGAFHDWLAFYDISGEKPRLIKEYYSEAPVVKTDGKDDEFHLTLLPETTQHYYCIEPFDGGILLNYFGMEVEKIQKLEFTNHLLKYSWQGELLGVYTTDEKFSYMRASDDGNTVYATSYFDVYPETRILKFNLN